MADLGTRSIQANVENTTSATLSVQSAQLSNPGMTRWIPGAEPKVGDQLKPFEAATWGALSDKAGTTVAASVTLGGFGSPPVAITMKHDGTATVSVADNDKIKSVLEPGGGDPGHGIYDVILSAK